MHYDTSVNRYHPTYKYNDFFSIIQKKTKKSFLDFVQAEKFPANLFVDLLATHWKSAHFPQTAGMARLKLPQTIDGNIKKKYGYD